MSFDLSQALLCINCDFVFGQKLRKCPRCQSENVYNLSRWLKSYQWLNRKEKIDELKNKQGGQKHGN